MNKRVYGWYPQLPDFRDFKYAAPAPILKALPPLVDLRPFMPPVYDQESLGSCTANAIGAGHQMNQIKQYLSSEASSDAEAIAVAIAKSFIPSRLFIYWNERFMEGGMSQVMTDSGAAIRDGVKSLSQHGVCSENMWPYNIGKFAERAPDVCYIEALNHQAISYHSVPQSLNQMKGCLAEGFPFEFGFSVYSSLESDEVVKTGIIPMPKSNESQRGGHAVLAVGYDDANQWFIVRNSWGDKWGDKGYCYMPYDYLTNPGLAADFWTIRLVEIDGEDIPNPRPAPEPIASAPALDPSLVFMIAKQFLDAVSVELNKGSSTESAITEGLKATQAYISRVV